MESQYLPPTTEVEALRSVPDEDLMLRLAELVNQKRRVEADLVAHIGEVEARRLFAKRTFPSMFAYCTQALHLSEAEAYRRITVARAARRFDGLLDRLRDGRIHLTPMALIVPVLKPANCHSVLARATHRSKREIQELVAELSPRPDVPAAIRKLPRRRMAPATSRGQHSGAACQLVPGTVDGPAPSTGSSRDSIQEQARNLDNHSGLGAGPELFPETVEPTGRPPRDYAVTRLAVVQPLSPARYKVQFTASQRLRDMLERLTALMRSEVPDGDLAAIVERAVAEKLQRLETRRFGTTRAPRKTLADTATTSGSRKLPAALRRAVYERDEGRCRFVDGQGRRCPERHRLEFHHHFPFGKGGEPSLGNVRLLCEQHNRYFAEVDYGKAAVQARVEDSRRKRRARPQPGGAVEAGTMT